MYKDTKQTVFILFYFCESTFKTIFSTKTFTMMGMKSDFALL